MEFLAHFNHVFEVDDSGCVLNWGEFPEDNEKDKGAYVVEQVANEHEFCGTLHLLESVYRVTPLLTIWIPLIHIPQADTFSGPGKNSYGSLEYQENFIWSFRRSFLDNPVDYDDAGQKKRN